MLLLNTTRDALLTPLQSVAGVVEKRQTQPILSNVLLDKQGNSLTLLANDMEIQITTRTECAGESGEDATLTVGARKLLDILRALPGEQAITLTFDDNRLTLKAGRGRFVLQTLPAKDYPRLSLPEGSGVGFSLPQGVFKRQLHQVSYAMAQQDIRYYLNGLLLSLEGNQLRMVATDGHRLGFAANALSEEMPATSVILPRKTVNELSRQLADNDDPLEVVLASNQVLFRFGQMELLSKLIDGRFPDYQRVIPSKFTKELLVDRQALLAVLARAAILSNEKFRGVRLSLEPGVLKIASSNTEHEEAQEELEVDYQGETLDVSFNVTYLLDVLQNVSHDHVVLRLNDPSTSALFMLPGTEQFKYVVMPMRI